MTAVLALALRIAMAIALYFFLGRALLTLRQELKRQAGDLASQQRPRITLQVLNDPQQVHPSTYPQDEITIGRDKNCDLLLTDEAVSARHAHITHHHRQWWLEDLQSMNGTFLNHEKLNTPAVLTTGDEIQCGGTVIRIYIESDNKSSRADEDKRGDAS